MLDPDFKVKWVEALRSGDYLQARRSLRIMAGPRGPQYCCLGVAACLLIGQTEFGSVYEPETLGITGTQLEVLVCLNDDGQWGFDRIADYIEENL